MIVSILLHKNTSDKYAVGKYAVDKYAVGKYAVDKNTIDKNADCYFRNVNVVPVNPM